MRLTQKVIDEIQVAMQHTKMNGDVNWVDGDEIDVCRGGTFAGDKFINLFDINGRKVLSTNLVGDVLDISSFSAGFYMIEVSVGDSKKVSKLVIE